MAWRHPGAVDVERALGAVLAVLRERPLVGVAVIGTLLVAVFAYAALRWYRRPTAERLRRLFASTESVSVLLHPDPDPDAMGAGMGVAQIATRAGADVTIQHPGEIRHHENRSFRNVLELDVDPVEDAADLAGETVVLVDHNAVRGITGAERVDPDAIVDHHPGDGDGALLDVRPEYGAAATIVGEYLETLGADPGAQAEDEATPLLPPPVATGLLYGILADTDHLTNGTTPAEFDVARFLSAGVDEDALDRIANPEMDAETLEVKARAVQERTVDGPFAVSHVGALSNADAIPQAADELVRLEGVTAVVVSGEREGTLHLSGRSRDDRVHMGRVIETVVEDLPMADGGGHARMGGGQVSIDHMEGIGPSDGVSIEEFHERLLDAMAGE
ncbi:MAG: bifunctional oligoribonuclease/PAP phosphatase NrnA [Halanaeroarchaeum sp.]